VAAGGGRGVAVCAPLGRHAGPVRELSAGEGREQCRHRPRSFRTLRRTAGANQRPQLTPDSSLVICGRYTGTGDQT
jgi:hypothetical protein